MGHSFGDGMIVAAIAAAVVAFLYFRHVERRRRLEIVHHERMAAMDKGIPLPELPLDAAATRTPPNPHEPLLHGIVWLALGGGAILAMRLFPAESQFHATLWPVPLPLALLGVGLILYYALASRRSR